MAEREGVIALQIDTEDWMEGEGLLLFVGEFGRRTMAEAQYVSSRPGIGIVKLSSSWRVFDVRARIRYPVSIKVLVNVGAYQSLNGIVQDVSEGGMAVRLSEQPSTDEVEIAIEDAGFSSRLPCRIANTHLEGEETVLHLAFLELSGAQVAFIRSLVARAAALAEEAELAA